MFKGWWGQNLEERYKFLSDFKPADGAKAWSISQTGLFQCVALESSLEIFDEVGINNLREKSIKLTGYLEILVDRYLSKWIKIISPRNKNERGCQLSLAILGGEKDIDGLSVWLLDNGVICSTRKPNIMRVAPIPLFNKFRECWDFVMIIKGYYDKQMTSKL